MKEAQPWDGSLSCRGTRQEKQSSMKGESLYYVEQMPVAFDGDCAALAVAEETRSSSRTEGGRNIVDGNSRQERDPSSAPLRPVGSAWKTSLESPWEGLETGRRHEEALEMNIIVAGAGNTAERISKRTVSASSQKTSSVNQSSFHLLYRTCVGRQWKLELMKATTKS